MVGFLKIFPTWFTFLEIQESVAADRCVEVNHLSWAELVKSARRLCQLQTEHPWGLRLPNSTCQVATPKNANSTTMGGPTPSDATSKSQECELNSQKHEIEVWSRLTLYWVRPFSFSWWFPHQSQTPAVCDWVFHTEVCDSNIQQRCWSSRTVAQPSLAR